MKKYSSFKPTSYFSKIEGKWDDDAFSGTNEGVDMVKPANEKNVKVSHVQDDIYMLTYKDGTSNLYKANAVRKPTFTITVNIINNDSEDDVDILTLTDCTEKTMQSLVDNQIKEMEEYWHNQAILEMGRMRKKVKE